MFVRDVLVDDDGKAQTNKATNAVYITEIKAKDLVKMARDRMRPAENHWCGSRVHKDFKCSDSDAGGRGNGSLLRTVELCYGD